MEYITAGLVEYSNTMKLSMLKAMTTYQRTLDMNPQNNHIDDYFPIISHS